MPYEVYLQAALVPTSMWNVYNCYT